MVADSAVTNSTPLSSGKVVVQVLNGVHKLQIIPHLQAGISVWGRGSIPTSQGEISTDIWLMDFIERSTNTSSIDEFANMLAKESQNALAGKQDCLGFHLAGYVQDKSETLPTFYHIRNVDGTYKHYTFHDFISGQDYAPKALRNNEVYLTRNGDYGVYAALATATQQLLPHIQSSVGMNIPHPSLQGRLAYHRAWVTFVSDLYASSGLLRTIGGNVSALGIYPDGNIVYLPN